MRILIKIYLIYAAIIVLLFDWAYYVNWLEPLPDGQYHTSLKDYIYRHENEIVNEASLIIKGKVLKSLEFEVVNIDDFLISPRSYIIYLGTIYDIQVSEVYYSDDDINEGDIIKVHSSFSSRSWADNCIQYKRDDEYIFFLNKITSGTDRHAEKLSSYNILIPWSDTILITSEGEYIFSKVFRSLRNVAAVKKFRPDLYERHLYEYIDDYYNLLNRLLHKAITPEEYKQSISGIESGIYETWARNDAAFINDLMSMITKYKSRDTYTPIK